MKRVYYWLCCLPSIVLLLLALQIQLYHGPFGGPGFELSLYLSGTAFVLSAVFTLIGAISIVTSFCRNRLESGLIWATAAAAAPGIVLVLMLPVVRISSSS